LTISSEKKASNTTEMFVGAYWLTLGLQHNAWKAVSRRKW